MTASVTGRVTLNRKSLRIALLLKEASVLDESHWQAYVNATVPRNDKSIWEILNQSVSLQKLGNLLLTDVKDLIPGRSRPELADSMLQPVLIRPVEIAALLKTHNTDVAPLCHLLLSKGLLTEEKLRATLEEADRNALSVHEVLVASNILTPETVRQIVEDPQNSVSRSNRALAAGEILIYNNLITKEDYSRALDLWANRKIPLWRALQEYRLLSQAELFQSLENIELPQIELIAYPVSMELLERFPRDFMRRQSFVPVSVQDSHYEIATNDPFNLAVADTITLFTGHRVCMLYARQEEVLTKLQALFPEMDETLSRMPPSLAARRPHASASEDSSSGNGAGDAAMRIAEPDYSFKLAGQEPYVDNLDAVQLLSRIVESAIAARATDIHIEPMADSVRVRYRVDGQLHSIMSVPLAMAPFLAARIKVLAQMNVTERRRPQDGHFDLETIGSFYDFRVSTLPSIHGEKIVLRVLDSTRVMTGLPELGLDENQMQTVQKLLTRPNGLVLVTGPTGSGKTSTLYSCLSAVNRDGINIITIEDPVEYQLEGITQVQVDTVIDLTFAAGLRSALRQDPDVIMVGEVRDPDTARTAIRASLTGHLVFSTLHTNTALGAISALSHMDIAHYLIGSALSGIIAQRLVRKNCLHCKKGYAPQKQVLVDLGLAGTTRRKFYQGAGCELCFGTGFSGRTGIFEIVELDDELRKAISDHVAELDLAQLAHRKGQHLLQSGAQRIMEGITTPAEVLKAVSLHG